MRRPRLHRPGQAADRLGRCRARDRLVDALVGDAPTAAGAALDVQAIEEAAAPRRWRCWPWSPGKTSNRSAMSSDRHGRLVADRPPGRRGPGDLDCRSRGAARAQEPCTAARTGSRRTWRSSRTPVSITDCALTTSHRRHTTSEAARVAGRRCSTHRATGRLRGACRFRLRHWQMPVPRSPRPGTPGGDQAVAAATDGPRRVHHRRLHRRPATPARRPAPPVSPARSSRTGRDLRRGLSRLPAARAVHTAASGRP